MILSEKRLDWDAIGDYKEEDIKKFIKELKKIIRKSGYMNTSVAHDLFMGINKLAGEDLI